MASKNILILSAGRRVELVKCFKDAAEKLGIHTKIFAADISNTAPALYFADEFRIVSRINSGRYIDDIIEICNNDDIDLIIPTIDTELEILAKNKELIESKTNAIVHVSSERVVEICNDKIKSYDFFVGNGFLAPRLITEEDIKNEYYQLPLFIKPLNGSSSINTFKINKKEELEFFYNYIKEPMVQEFIAGDEFTIDVFCDFSGKVISVTPRIRIATRSGEILKGQINKDPEVVEDVIKLVKALNPIGHITVQCMKTERGIEYIEINPRFGGGAPMSIKAGADSCEYLYRLLMGEELEYMSNAKDGMYFSRFDDCVVLDKELRQIK